MISNLDFSKNINLFQNVKKSFQEKYRETKYAVTEL